MMEFLMKYGAIIASILVAGILLVYKFYFADKDSKEVSFDLGSMFGGSGSTEDLEDAAECIGNVCKRGRPKKNISE